MSTRADLTKLWLPFLEARGFVVLDGGLATELERRGAWLDDPLWSAKLLLERPDLIREVHEDYFRAGADVGTSASYQATIPGLVRRGLSHQQAAELLRRSVRLVHEALEQVWSEIAKADRQRPVIAASLGSYGAYLADGSEFRGDYDLTVQELIDWHRPRVEVLADSGADVLAFETVPCQHEAEAIVRLLEEFSTMPAWLSFSCRDERHLCHGETLLDALKVAASAANVIAAGVNCTAPRHVAGLLASVAGIDVPLLVYPNSGEIWNACTRSWIEDSDSLDWTRVAQTWHAAGAKLIGGCCRTTPETIRQIAGYSGKPV